MGKKIMIVDDAAFMRMTIKNCLTKAGYSELIEAEDGAVAVDNMRRKSRIWSLWILPFRT